MKNNCSGHQSQSQLWLGARMALFLLIYKQQHLPFCFKKYLPLTSGRDTHKGCLWSSHYYPQNRPAVIFSTDHIITYL